MISGLGYGWSSEVQMTELAYKLTKAQDKAFNPLHRAAGDSWSWVLTRHQGTGLTYWKIDLNDGPEWSGDHDYTVDGRTITEVIDRALTVICLAK